MSQELSILSLAVALGIVQLFAAAKASINQRGSTWAAGARDTPAVPLTGMGGRVDRAFKNFLETFPFFATAVLIGQAAGVHNDCSLWGCRIYLAARLLYVPAYLVGVPFVRTVFWFLSLAGIVAVLLAPLV